MVEDPATGAITDLVSFYSLPSLARGPSPRPPVSLPLAGLPIGC